MYIFIMIIFLLYPRFLLYDVNDGVGSPFSSLIKIFIVTKLMGDKTHFYVV